MICVLLSLAFGFIRLGSAEYDNCFLHFVSGMWPSLCTRSGMSLVCVVICIVVRVVNAIAYRTLIFCVTYLIVRGIWPFECLLL